VTFVFRESGGKPITLGDLVLLIDLLGSDRFIYGADWPWAYEYPYSTVDSIRNDLKTIGDLPISEEEKNNILGGTLERLIRLE